MNQDSAMMNQLEGEIDSESLTQEQQLLYEQQIQDANIGTFRNVTQGLEGPYVNIMTHYWQDTIDNIENNDHEFKIHQLPLARIKKVMKADEDVKMISAEAPILFAKGCDIFITELTKRAWIHAEENKRRTLQRSDIASALQRSDMFDFLIDIVPREEALASSARKSQPQVSTAAQVAAASRAAAAEYEQFGDEVGLAQLDDEQLQQQQLQYQQQMQQYDTSGRWENDLYNEYQE